MAKSMDFGHLKCEIHVFLITFYIALFKFLRAIFDLSNKIALLILLRVFLYEPCVLKKFGSLKVESFLKSSLDLSLAQLSLEKIVNSSTQHVCSYCHTLHGAHKAQHGGQLLIKAVNSPTFVIRPSTYCLISCNFYSTSNMVL